MSDPIFSNWAVLVSWDEAGWLSQRGQISNLMMWSFVQLWAGERSQTFKRQFGAKKGERLTLWAEWSNKENQFAGRIHVKAAFCWKLVVFRNIVILGTKIWRINNWSNKCAKKALQNCECRTGARHRWACNMHHKYCTYLQPFNPPYTRDHVRIWRYA